MVRVQAFNQLTECPGRCGAEPWLQSLQSLHTRIDACVYADGYAGLHTLHTALHTLHNLHTMQRRRACITPCRACITRWTSLQSAAPALHNLHNTQNMYLFRDPLCMKVVSDARRWQDRMVAVTCAVLVHASGAPGGECVCILSTPFVQRLDRARC